MAHALTENRLPGLDEQRLARLAGAGLSSLEDVVDAGPCELARVTGFDLDTARALVRVAEGMVMEMAPVIELASVHPEPPARRLARGLRGARDIEQVRSGVRKVRAHLGRRAARARWRKSHKKARKQLSRLMDALEALQREVLSDGLSRAALLHLQNQLRPISNQVERSLEKPLRKRLFKRLSRHAKRARHRL